MRGDVPIARLVDREDYWVFPACAGMFPWVRKNGAMRPPFSPRARGCSAHFDLTACSSVVFPACAGMFRVCKHQKKAIKRFPRVRGDVPDHHSAPHARHPVFPACAGMFRQAAHATGDAVKSR